ncbi:MAG: response regulator [Clostridiales Family XIII bacterium]|jgi:signal transduction histidine kinase|nr:response regulator [Clostridiales Family XIII bacterium]
MFLPKKTVVLITIVIIAVDAALILAGYFLSGSGGAAVVALPVAVIAAVLITLLPIRAMLRRLKAGAEKLDKFLSFASAGHLDKRIEVDETGDFAKIEESLNAMMENMDKMSRAKSDFLSSMSHEIRTPMSAIIGMAQIARGAKDEERIQDCLQKIEDNSKHLIGVINDILDFSKLESGKLLLDEQLFSLKEDLTFVESMFHGKMEEKGLGFRISIKNITHDGIVTDSLRLNQVLINLLSNAVKFTDSGGSVSLSVSEVMHVDGESVYSFAINDTGIGIEPEQAKKLFTPFVQANASTTKRYGGTGLGLVISKNIVEKMGGDIELDSIPGEGSTFSFTIRVAAQEEAEHVDTDEEENAAPDFHGKRLLIVDDIEINREIAVEILRETDVEMETAENGQVALDMFLAAPEGYYDMILMDMQMPVMDGCEATEMIRKSGREDSEKIKIVAVTANVMRDDIMRVYASGMNGHIGKPIDFGEAYKIMAKMLQ